MALPVLPTSVRDDLSLPRILCLHGGGVNAAIFRIQCRQLIEHLPDFRLVFADAPWLSEPGPGMVPVYAAKGPFRRWLRWKPSHPDIGDAATVNSITGQLEDCRSVDEGSGPWVGILGFSQGAKLAASLLYDQQLQMRRNGYADTSFQFGVLMAGRAPLLSLRKETEGPGMMQPGEMSLRECEAVPNPHHVVALPTLHVHGLTDPGLASHRQMAVDYFEKGGATSIVEWQGDHRVVLKRADVELVTRQIYRLAKEAGVRL